MVAVNPEARGFSGSVNVATCTLPVLVFSVAVTASAVTVIGAPDTLAVLVLDAVPADTPVSVTVTVVVNLPLLVYVWPPVTVNVPPEPVIVPVSVEPSPQLMLAVNSPDVSVPGSVNVATSIVPVLAFSVAVTGSAVTDRSASDTVAVLLEEALPPLTPVSVTVTVVLNVPSLFV
jgi:hypothetical protein